MKVKFDRKFLKDLAEIPKVEDLGMIKDATLRLEMANDLRTLGQVKTLQGCAGILVNSPASTKCGCQICQTNYPTP